MPPLKSYSPQNEYNGNGNNNSPTENTSGASGSSEASTSNVTTLNIQRSNTKSPPYCNGQYPFKVLSNLQQLRSQKRFCDVDIVAGKSLENNAP